MKKLHATSQTILSVLRQSGGDISGEDLCRDLKISRAAVWKHIQSLRELGYAIGSATHRGYRLTAAPNLPLPWEIEGHLETARLGREIEYCAVAESTNPLAIEAAKNQAAEGFCVVADQQKQGRGRLRRPWFSPPSRNLYLSVVLRPPIAPLALPQISLIAALALARACKDWLPESADIRVKWPNDVFVNQGKVAGILCESASETDRVHYAVVGIGVNLNLKTEDLPGEIADTATSLQIVGGSEVDRPRFAANLLNHLEPMYFAWCRDGLADFLPELEEMSLMRDRQVDVETVSGRRSGIAVGITEDGGLRLRNPQNDHEEVVYCGDISLTPVD